MGTIYLYAIRIFTIFVCHLANTHILANVPTPSVATQAPKASPKEVQKLVKEVRETKQQLKKNQDNLEKILKKLKAYDHVYGEVEEPKLERTSPLFTNLERFSLHLKDVLHNFFKGAECGIKLISAPNFKPESKRVLLWMLCVFLFSAVSHVVAYQHLLNRLSDRTQYNQMVGLRSLTTLMLPGLIYAILGWVWSIKQWFLPSVGTQFIAYLPFDTYVLIAGYRCVGVYFTSIVSNTFPSESVEKVSYAFQKIFFIYFFSKILKEILGLTSANALVFSTFSQVCAALVSFSIWSALTKAKNMIFSSETMAIPQKNRVLISLNILQWAVVVFSALWVFFPEIFLAFFIPTLVTSLVLLSTNALQPKAYRWFLGLVLKNRQRSFIFPFLYQHKRSVVSAVKLILYIGLLTLWGEVFQEIEHTNIFSIVHWVMPVITSPWVTRCINATLVGITSFLLIKLINKILRYYVEDRYSAQSIENNFLFSRLKTMMAIIRTIVNVFVGGPALIFMISHIFGVELKEWAASVGVAGFGLTFGLQSIVRDFITGFFIIFENNLMVGDEVDIDGRGGKVEAITVRTVKIRSDNGALTTIPFGSIVAIANRNKHFSAVLMNISVRYEEDLDKVQKLIEKAFLILKKNSAVKRYVLGNLEYRGVNEVTSYSVVLLAKIRTAPNCQDQVRRQFNRILKELFDEAGVVLPSVGPGYISTRLAPSLTNTQV